MTAPGDDTDGAAGSASAPEGEDPAYGPGGYLPPRAAKRARKIVLRERMGLHWPIAAVAAGVVILLLIIPALVSTQGPPGAPYVAAGPLDAVDPRGDAVLDVDGTAVLVVRGGGVLRAFLHAPDGPRYCGESGRLEAADGRIWSAEGRLLAGAGGDSLDLVGVLAFDGELYLDTSQPVTAGQPRLRELRPSCALSD